MDPFILAQFIRQRPTGIGPDYSPITRTTCLLTVTAGTRTRIWRVVGALFCPLNYSDLVIVSRTRFIVKFTIRKHIQGIVMTTTQ